MKEIRVAFPKESQLGQNRPLRGWLGVNPPPKYLSRVAFILAERWECDSAPGVSTDKCYEAKHRLDMTFAVSVTLILSLIFFPIMF